MSGCEDLAEKPLHAVGVACEVEVHQRLRAT